MGLLDTLTQVLGGGNAAPQMGNAAQQIPTDALGSILASTFRSNETPAIGNLVGQLFGNSSGQQQAGMLNQILATIGPVAAAAMAGGALGKVMSPGATEITPEQAAKLSPSDVEAVVNQAHETNPSLADQLGTFYAQHSTLINTLGGVAATYALSKMKDRMAQKG